MIVFLLGISRLILGHGMIHNPPGRGTLWRYLDSNPLVKQFESIINKNWNDMANNCGGTGQQKLADGKCGPCGDAYNDSQPRKHEFGGLYGKGITVAKYTAGTMIELTVQLTAHHKGYFEFGLCPQSDSIAPNVLDEQLSADELSECLSLNKLLLEDGGTRWTVPDPSNNNNNNWFKIRVQLPDIVCLSCVLQWKYHGGNSWGCDEENDCGVGKGIQEEFYNCADIAITRDGPTTTTSSTTVTSISTTETTTKATGIKTQKDTCVDLNDIYHGKNGLGYKVDKLEGYSSVSQKEDSTAAVQCAGGFKLNLRDKLSTKAYCRCDDNGDCIWKFNKGDVKCIPCPYERLQGKNGTAIVATETWADSGIYSTMSVFFRFKPVSNSVEEGWSIALDFADSLSSNVVIECGNIKVTAVSEERRLFTFMPKSTSVYQNLLNLEIFPKKLYLWCKFSGLTASEITYINQLTLYYFKQPVIDASCLVDRYL